MRMSFFGNFHGEELEAVFECGRVGVGFEGGCGSVEGDFELFDHLREFVEPFLG